MKRLTLILLALLLCFSIIACDNTQNPGDGDDTDTSTGDKTDTDTGEGDKTDTGTGEGGKTDKDETKPPEKAAVTTVTEEQWKAAFESFDSESFSVSMKYRVGEFASQIRKHEITDNVVHILYDEDAECYSQKLNNDSYVTYIRPENIEKFTQMNDVSSMYFDAGKRAPFISFANLFSEFTYNAELGAYVCEKTIEASYCQLPDKDYSDGPNCASTVIRFEDGKLANVSTVAGDTAYTYSDIEDDAVKIPDSVINGAVRETKIYLDKDTAEIDIGDTVTITATTVPEVDASFLIWTSSNPSVATVNSSGIVTGISHGTTTITVKTPNGFSASCDVTVSIYGGAVIPSGAPTYNVTWERTELKYALTNSSSANELKSGCKKYYSGTEVTGAPNKIDVLVAERNLAAAQIANVSVRFDYETASGGWGTNIETIVSKSKSGSSESPDIYACFVYDLSCAQLRDCFANLLQTGKANYFRFTQHDYIPWSANYFDSQAGEGYFLEYMRSLTLSDDKMFILASNYCLDVIRSMLVVPMNVEAMSTLVSKDSNGNNNSYTGDMVEVSDFYDLVWRTPELVDRNAKYKEGFTYDVIAHYAAKFYIPATDPNDVLSGKVAFAIGSTSGLPASGILYTTSVQIISKTADANNPGQYIYSYPTDNPELDQFATAITNLFHNRDGVLAVKQADAGISNYDTELVAIREKFAKGNVLFGGVVALGSLDESVYQSMRVEGKKMGFGILPVPLYRSNDASGNPEEYKTLVHNIAKVVAISKHTPKFSQCTAYLDYLSRMSQDVVEEYYEANLTSAVGGMAEVFNEVMLTYIRNHVRNCFDKTFDDAILHLISVTDGSAATNSRLHEVLSFNRFDYDKLIADYKSYAAAKERKLQEAVIVWNEFTD